MFAEQPSVKLCCQLCCSVFKDPVITTCGVSRPPSQPPCCQRPPQDRRPLMGRGCWSLASVEAWSGCTGIGVQ